MTYASELVIANALINQVSMCCAAIALKNGHVASERDVVTYVSAEMWRIFCRVFELPENATPTPWQGSSTIRIYGSETHVIDKPGLWSFSRPRTL